MVKIRAHAVVIGGSAAGVAAAVGMRTAGFEGSITVVDSDACHPYERPPLSKLLLEATRPPLIDIVPAAVFEANEIDLRLGETATELDLRVRRVRLASGDSLPADRLLLATGASARRIEVPGADLENVLYLRHADDAFRLWDRLSTGGPLVLVGSGYIGLEVAAAARARGVDVTVIDVVSMPLVASLGHELAPAIVELHRARGVRFAFNSRVHSFSGAGAVEAVSLEGGVSIAAATVVVGVGVVANVSLARAAGVGNEHGVPVDAYGATGVDGFFAAGDVTIQSNSHLEHPSRVEHWDSAQRQGGAVGATMAGRPTAHDAVPYVWSEQYGLLLQCFGRPHSGDELVVRGTVAPDHFVAYWLREGRVAAVAALNSPRDAAAGRHAVESELPVSAAALADPTVDLRQLARSLRSTSGS